MFTLWCTPLDTHYVEWFNKEVVLRLFRSFYLLLS